MEDYIDVLLASLSEGTPPALSWEYHAQRERARQAREAVLASLSHRQQTLFRAYEEARCQQDAMRWEADARRVFLLAREIFR